MAISGAALLVRSLAAAGVRYLFTVSGNQILSVYDACLDHGIGLIHVRHEAAAAYMADGWGRMTEQPGVALVPAGPGHTNGLTPLFVAAAAESPTLLLSGHCRLADVGRGAFQEMDQVAVANPLVKASWLVRDPRDMGQQMVEAFRLAVSGRPGPVHVSIPVDVLEGEMMEREAVIPSADDFRVTAERPPGRPLEEALDLLLHAHRPVILAGPAMARPSQWAAVVDLVELTHVPALPVESPRGPRDPRLGAVATRLSDADVVVLLGKKLDFTLRFGDLFAAAARLICIDPDGRQEPKHASLLIKGNPLTVTLELIERAKDRSWPQRDAWIEELERAKRRGRDARVAGRQASGGGIHPLELCRVLSAYFTDETVFVSDGGEFGQWAQAILSAGYRLINGPSGAIGGAIPLALAAKLARPQARVITIMGDGAFGFHALEFDTAVRHGLPIVAIVGNDAAWNAERQIQIRNYGPGRTVGCDLLPSRYDRVVQGLGGHGEYVENLEEFGPALERAIESGKPACVNVTIEGVAAP